jgi:hypothetical protein
LMTMAHKTQRLEIGCRFAFDSQPNGSIRSFIDGYSKARS